MDYDDNNIDLAILLFLMVFCGHIAILCFFINSVKNYFIYDNKTEIAVEYQESLNKKINDINFNDNSLNDSRQQNIDNIFNFE